VRAQTRHHATRDDFENAAERVALCGDLVDERRSFVCARRRRMCSGASSAIAAIWSQVIRVGVGNAAELDYVTPTSIPNTANNCFAKAPHATRRGLAARRVRGCSQIAHVVLQPAGRSACPGRGRLQTRDFLGRDLARSAAITSVQLGQSLLSIIRRKRRAERETVYGRRQYLGVVALDLHPPTASVAELATTQLVIDRSPG
jgi:hypothetical protein